MDPLKKYINLSLSLSLKVEVPQRPLNKEQTHSFFEEVDVDWLLCAQPQGQQEWQCKISVPSFMPHIPKFLRKLGVKWPETDSKKKSLWPWFLIKHVIEAIQNIYKLHAFALSVLCHVRLSLSETN